MADSREMSPLRLWVRRQADEWLPWTALRGFGNSPVVRASMVMPVVGYLILLNDHLIHWGELHPQFRLFASDNPWRLIFLYWGTFCIAIASVAYAMCCPTVIKLYAHAVEFFNDAERYVGHGDKLREMAEGTAHAARRLRGDELERLSRKSAGFFDRPGAVLHDARANPGKIFDAAYEMADIAGRGWRLLCGCFFSLGFILLGIPAGVTLLGVARQTYRMLVG
jgi:hypothetical protein